MPRYPTLRTGDAGEYVTYVQEVLVNEFGGTMAIPPEVTGVFDQETDAAVRAFQVKYGLDADGVVGPDTWTVIVDLDPRTAQWGSGADVLQEVIDMPPMLVGDRFHEQRDPGAVADPVREWEERLILNASYGEQLSNWEVLPLLPLVGQRFQTEAGGYGLEAFEYDPTHGYETAVLRLWFGALEAIKQEASAHLLHVAELLGNWAVEERADPLQVHDGWGWWLATKLGGAVEPSLVPLDWVDEHVAACRQHVDQGRARSAAGSLASAMRAQSWYFDAWAAYVDDRATGLGRMETALEITEEVAEEILITAATGGLGRLVKTGGVVVKAGIAVGTEVAVEVGSNLAEQLGEMLLGEREEFTLTDEMLTELKSAIPGMAGKVASGLLAKSWSVERIAGPVADLLAPAFDDHSKAATVAHYAVRKLLADAGEETVKAAVSLGIDDDTGRTFDSGAAFATHIVGTAVQKLAPGAVKEVLKRNPISMPIRGAVERVVQEELGDYLVARFIREAQ